MASFRKQYEDLFGPIPDYDPIKPSPYPDAGQGFEVDTAFRSALPLDEEPAAPSGNLFPLRSPPKREALADDGTSFMDPLRNIAAGVADTVGMAAGAAEYGLRQSDAPPELTQGFAGIRRDTAEVADILTQQMTPEARDRLAREFLSLDPSRTIWQGSPYEVVSSVGYKLGRSLPSSALTLLGARAFMKAGMSGGGIAYLGASEAGLSVGGIANGIAQEIESMDDGVLMQESQRFRQLVESGMDSATAREQLTKEAQGVAPLVGGALVGVISATAGRYLEPILVGGGMPLAQRLGRGFVAEGLQEGPQSGVETYVQNLAAKIYDADRSAMEGVPEAFVEGTVVGGITGGGFTGAFGQRPQPPAAPPPAPEQPPPAAPIDRGTPGASFEELFGPPPTQSFQQVFGEDPGPQLTSTERLQVDMGELDPAVAAAGAAAREDKRNIAENIRQDGMMGDLFANEGAEAQMPLDLEPPPLELTPPGPIQTPPAGPDLSQPPGALADERQPDLFTGYAGPAPAQPAQAALTAAQRGTTKRGAYEVVLKAPDGAVMDRQEFTDYAEAERLAQQYLDDPQLQEAQVLLTPITTATPLPQQAGGLAADQPTAEPVSDLLAQIEDMETNATGFDRAGVYVSPDNLRALNEAGLSDAIRGAGVQLANFDGKGGLLIAKDRQTAEDLMEMRDEGRDMQEILGFATRAGVGKPAAGQFVVQVRNRNDAVVRETLEATSEGADALAAELKAASPEGYSVIVRPVATALRRRAKMVAAEAKQKGQRKQRLDYFERVTGLAERQAITPEEETEALASKTPGRAASRITVRTVQQAKKEEQQRIGGFYPPEALQFEDSSYADRYKKAFDRLVEVELQRELRTGDQKKVEEERDSLYEELSRVRQIGRPVRKVARQLTKAKLINPDLQESDLAGFIETVNDSDETRNVLSEFDPPPYEELQELALLARDPTQVLPDATAERQAEAQERAIARIEELFEQAIQFRAGLIRKVRETPTLDDETRAALVGTKETAEASERLPDEDVADPSYAKALGVIISTGTGNTVERLRTLHKTFSSKLRLIRRASATLQMMQSEGFTRGSGKKKSTATAAGAVTEEAATGDELVSIGGTFNAGELLSPAVPQDESKAARAARLEAYKKAKAELEAALIEARKYFNKTGTAKEWRDALADTDKNGKPTELARRTAIARAYFRSMVRYGQLALKVDNPAPNAIKQLNRLTKWFSKVPEMERTKFTTNMSKAMTATLKQSREMMYPDLRQKLAGELRMKTLLKHNQMVAAAAARAERLELLANNAFFRNLVRPTIDGFTNSILRDGWPSFRPSPEQLKGVRFSLSRWRVEPRLKESHYDQVRQYFSNLGFKFDEAGDLILPVNEEGQVVYQVTDEILEKQLSARELGWDDVDDTGDAIQQMPFAREALTADQLNQQMRKAVEDEVVIERRIENKALAKDLVRYAQVNSAIERFVARVSNSKTTIDGLIDAERRFVKAMKQMGVWRDHPSPKMGQVLVGDTIRTTRLVAYRLQNAELSKEEARKLMLSIKPLPLPESYERALQALRPEDRRNMEREMARAAKEPIRWGKQPESFFMRYVSDPSYSTEFKAAARDVHSLLADRERAVNLPEVMEKLLTHIPHDHPYRLVAQRLAGLNLDNVRIRYDWGGMGKGKPWVGRYIAGLDDLDGSPFQYIVLNNERLADYGKRGIDSTNVLLHTVLHEGVHAATREAIRKNPQVRDSLMALRKAAADWYTANNLQPTYGVKEEIDGKPVDIDEFVAEAWSNPRFQQALKLMPAPDQKQKSLWDRFKDLIRAILRLPIPAQNQQSMWDVVFEATDSLFTAETPTADTQMNLIDPTVSGTVNAVVNTVKEAASARKAMWQNAAFRKAPLVAMTMEQIRDVYSEAFSTSDGNPLKRYMSAFFQRNAENSRLMEDAEKLVQRWTQLRQDDPDGALELSRIATESSLYEVAADQPLDHKSNEHLKTPEAKARWREFSDRYKRMSPGLQKLYGDLQTYYTEALRNETSLLLTNALRSVLTKGSDATMEEADFDSAYPQARVRKMMEDGSLADQFKGVLDEDMLSTIRTIAQIGQRRRGNYFPLMRYGDYVVYSEKAMEAKKFADSKEAYAYAEERRNADPTLTTGVFKEKGSDSYIVKVSVKEFRAAESITEAEANRRDMIARYGAENVSTVQKKSKFAAETAIQSNAALSTILKSLEGNAAAQMAIKDYYLRSLADSSFRKHEIRRKNRRGVDFDLQHRTFANYAKQSAYYTAQLKYGWKMADAIRDMDEFIKSNRDESKATSVRMGEVLEEIRKRDNMAASLQEPFAFTKGGVELGQFMMLTSPSYWMINATQPWLITAPWLAAKYGWGDTVASMRNAQKLIVSPLVSQAVQSRAGLKALVDKVAAEKSFGVLSDVIEQIKREAPENAPRYVEMLEELRRYSIIDLSWIAELRDIAEGSDTSWTQKVLDSSRIMAHLTEVNNRILTAISAYDLNYTAALKAGTSPDAAHLAAIEFAKDATSTTQFNYSSANKPRLFQQNGPLGRMSPLVFQFMQWPQHMYALLFTNLAKALKGDKEARRILINVSATHLAVGGAIGWALQPIKWAVGLAMMALGDDDEPWTIENAISGESYDRVVQESLASVAGVELGGVLARGLPTAIGTDMSDRMSMGTLYYLDLRTDNAESFLGSLVTGFGGPVVSLGVNFGRGITKIANGEYARGLEMMTPKITRDFIRTWRYSTEGLVNNAGDTLLPANELPPHELFLQALGFTPDTISRRYSEQGVLKDTQRYAGEERDALLQRFRSATPAERKDITDEIREYNRRFPANPITVSTLVQTVTGAAERNARIRAFGANLNDREAAVLRDAGWYYRRD